MLKFFSTFFNEVLKHFIDFERLKLQVDNNIIKKV